MIEDQPEGGVTERLRLDYCGVFEVRGADGSTVEISSLKARALLAYLALSPNMRHSREHLAALLWDRSDDERARASLRQAVGALRRSLGPDCDKIFLTRNADYLALEPSRIDVALPTAETGNGVVSQTEFIEDLNIRSEPFEEWRRNVAAHLDSGRDDQPANGRANIDKTIDMEKQRSSANAESAASGNTMVRRFLSRAPLLAAVTGMAVIGAVLFVGSGGFETLNFVRKPYTHGQNSIEIMRQTAARQAHPELNQFIDRCEFDRSDPDDAIAACSRIIDTLDNVEPYKAVALTIRGSAHRWNGDFSQSTEDISQALLIDPTYHNAHHHMAFSYFLAGDYEQALDHYDRVKQLFPVYVMSHYRTGEVYVALKDFRKAEDAFSEAIELAPDFGHAYLMRGKTRLELGKTEAAKTDLRMAASLRPSLRTEAQETYAAFQK